MSRFLGPIAGLVLSLFILVPTGRAEDLTSPQHELKSNRSNSSIVRSGGTATLPFDITVTNERVGERYAGSVEVSFPEKISGSVDGTGTFLLVSPAVKGTVKLKFLYTTRTSDPADTIYPYALSGTLSDHAFPNVNYCEGPQIIERVGAGVYEINYSLECSWDKVPYDSFGRTSQVFNTVIEFTTNPSPGQSGGFRFFLDTSYKSRSTDLKVSAVDPNCASSTNCDAEYLEEDPATSFQTTRLVQNLGALKSASVTRTGIATDGVTMLLLRASVPEAAPADAKVTFNLKNASGATADAKWGVLMNRDGTAEGGSVTASTEHVADGKRYAFALYRAPLDHPATDSLNTTSVTIEATSTAKPDEKVSTSIKLIPPPVILIHGVWSNHQSWKNFENFHLRPAGFRICNGCRPDYGLSQPAPEFDPTLHASKFAIETVIHAIDAALQDVQRNGYAATQVDGIGHSMGGILLRALVAYRFDEYRKNRNYRKGDLHKIITAGSPHHGSSLVTWLIDHRCDQFSWAARTFDGKETIEREFLKQGKPMGPAIYGFQNASTALKNIGRTDVPGHAIIGIAPVTSGTEEFLNLIPYWTNNKDAVGNYLTIDAIAGGEGTHDTIVPVPSQRGVFSPGASTEVPGVVHANVGEESRDTDEPESPVVWNRIVELLKAPIGGSEFSGFEAHSPNPAEPLRVPAPCPAGKTGDDAKPAAAATVLPVAGTIVRPGGTMVLTLTASGGNPVEGVLFTVGNRNVIVKGTGPSFTYSYRVPDDRAGRLDIFAGTYGQTGENYYGESFVIVTPAEAPASIFASPDSVRLKDRGQQIQIVVSGTLPAGTEIDVTSSSAGTTYKSASGGTSVISVTPEGLVEAKGNGSDSVIVTHAGKTASVPVTVQFHVRRRVVRR